MGSNLPSYIVCLGRKLYAGVHFYKKFLFCKGYLCGTDCVDTKKPYPKSGMAFSRYLRSAAAVVVAAAVAAAPAIVAAAAEQDDDEDDDPQAAAAAKTIVIAAPHNEVPP